MSLPRTRLIVNADDFGYFDEVSRGILEAAERGVVTATGVMANGPALPRWFDKLKAMPSLSVGVHLNATLGEPITAQMRSRLAANDGQFRGKVAFIASVLSGQMPPSAVIEEWRAQVQHCVQLGLQLQFLNSHEHVHMLPRLYAGVRQLADQFGIVHVRAPQPEWAPGNVVGNVFRNTILTSMRGLVAKNTRNEPVLVGIAPSGRLNSTYCEWRLPRLAEGATYELMCHPGRDDRVARNNPRFAAYHDWEGELQTLVSPGFAQLLHRHRIALVSYAQLQ